MVEHESNQALHLRYGRGRTSGLLTHSLPLGLLVLLVAAGVIAGQARPSSPSEVRATKFTVVDSEGRARGEFGLTEEGDVQLRIPRTPDGPGVWIGVRKNGVRGVALFGEDRRPQIELVSESASALPGLTIYDKQGSYRLTMGVGDDGSVALAMGDGAARRRLVVGIGPDGTPSMHMLDASGKSRLIGTLSSDGSRGLLKTLSGDDVIWQSAD